MQSDDNFSKSKPHQKVERIIRSMGFNCESEREFSPYTVDIYLPEWHLAVEVDGPYHSKKKDEFRDRNLLENYGLYLLRFPSTNIKQDYVESTILAFIDRHYEDSEVRRNAWLKTMLSSV